MPLQQTKFQQNTSGLEGWSFLHRNLNEAAAFASRGKILVVDAAGKKLRKARLLLSDGDYEWAEAKTTSAAVSAISMSRVDLVLVDLGVPEIGGIEFCRMLKKAAATRLLPVFVLASADDPESEVAAIQAGADAFLAEPIRPRAFQARVEATLRRKAVIDSLDDSESVLFSLAQSVEERDTGLGEHCQRLARMATAMGMALGLAPADVLALQRGGYLHDIGKVAVPDSVLFKAGPLTADEWAEMKTHAERGERICSNMRSLAPVLPIIRHHHEKWNGTGYPDGLKGEQIPLLARIFQIVDVYDALTTARPYKRALSPEEALEVMRDETRKGWRDPRLVETFAEIMPMLRTPMAADFSRLSLQALANSVESFRKGPAYESGSSLVKTAMGPVKLVGAL